MPTDESMPPSIREAGAPFDAGDADIILRSSDNVDFRAHRLFLSKASPFFADMLSLPPGPTVDEEKDGIRVVNMSEDEESLRILVGYCYLALQPVVLDTLEDAERALRVADKFQLERARTRAVNKLRVFAKQEPERVYAFGWRLRSRDVVLAGALASLAKPYTVALPTLQGAEDLPSTILFKLLAYQKACIDAAQSVFDLSWLGLVQLRIESVEAAREYPFVRRALPDSTGHTIDQLNCMNRYTDCVFKHDRVTINPCEGDVASISSAVAQCLDEARSALKLHPRGEAVKCNALFQLSAPTAFSNACPVCANYHLRLLPPLVELLASTVERASRAGSAGNAL